MVDISRQEYLNASSVILQNTLDMIDPEKFTGYASLRSDETVKDIIAASAVTDSAGITVVYTPSGTAKTKLICSRARALIDAGIAPQDILVLNMNIAKTNDVKRQLPSISALTFNDFINGIFVENFPGILPSNEQSVIDMLRLLHDECNSGDLLENIMNKNVYSRNIMTALWVNKHINETIKILYCIGKADTRLQALVCHNRHATLRDPYGAKAIIVNGVHNMPLPILCTILLYSQAHRCNLFVTGAPEETVYEFSFAYDGAMNMLTSKSSNLHVIRCMNKTAIAEPIAALTDMQKHDFISPSVIDYRIYEDSNRNPATMNNVIAEMLSDRGYLRAKLSRRDPVLIMANYKQDLTAVKNAVMNMLEKDFPEAVVSDLTRIQNPPAIYGRQLVKYAAGLRNRYPNGIKMGELFAELYNILAYEASADMPELAWKYNAQMQSLPEWAEARVARFGGYDAKYEVFDAIKLIIDIEAEDIQEHIDNMHDSASINSENADVIFSTIHSAIDIRKPNAIIIIRSAKDVPDIPLRKVAMSRAANTEFLFFINEKPIRDPYQQYLTYMVR